MSIIPIWRENTTVKPYETDFQGNWKPHCFFQAMQHVATHHATHLGLGYHDMLQNNSVWLLARLKIKFFRIPQLDEKITVETWPRSMQQKIFFMRDFYFLDEKEQKIAAATSAWITVEVKERRILKPDADLLDGLPKNEKRVALQETLEKIAIPEQMQEQFNIQARYSAIDLIQHVNNTRYIEWASDCFPIEQYRNSQPDWIQINYASEVKPGERVSIQTGQLEDSTTIIAGNHLSNCTRAFEVAWAWK